MPTNDIKPSEAAMAAVEAAEAAAPEAESVERILIVTRSIVGDVATVDVTRALVDELLTIAEACISKARLALAILPDDG